MHLMLCVRILVTDEVKKMKISLEKPSLNELAHFGVKGMKWGHHNPKADEITSKRRSIPNKKSAHRVRLEAGYLKKGYSNDTAEQMAAKRIKGEKIALGILATAAVAGASYIAYQEIGKRYSNVILEAGKDLHYINALGADADYDRRLYTSFKKQDTAKYKGLLATALRNNAENTTVYDTVLRAKEDIKAPSHNEAAKLYKEFFGKTVDTKDYKLFNKDFVSGVNDPSVKGFVDFVKSKGYNAVLDSNDQFISGYNTKKPLILFNAASTTVKVGESIVTKQMSDRLNGLQMAAFYSKQMGPMLAPSVGLGLAAVGGSMAMDTSNRYGAVNGFFKKNPKSNYSYGEVYNAMKSKTVNGVPKYVIDKAKLKGVL